MVERGRLEFKTDDAGTLYLEWDKIASLVANRFVEVLTSNGQRYLGTLGTASARSISVVSLGGPFSLPMSDVTLITPIGQSFWSRIDGSIDLGYNYTRSSGVAQFNLNSDTLYRRPAASSLSALCRGCARGSPTPTALSAFLRRSDCRTRSEFFFRV